MKRIDKNEYYSLIARVVSLRGTCPRRQVGCVLINSHGHILSTGYNGKPSGQPHCNDEPCPGKSLPSGTGLDLCEAIHAEQNALLQCPNVQEIEACYTTTFPCIHCLKLLMNTSCKKIFYVSDYIGSVGLKEKWFNIGRECFNVDLTHRIM